MKEVQKCPRNLIVSQKHSELLEKMENGLIIPNLSTAKQSYLIQERFGMGE